jgi:uncharacterized membrane protein
MDRFITLSLAWLSTLAVFLALDGVWLGIVGGSMYRGVLGELMLDGFRIVPAAAFYLLYITGIFVFVMPLARGRTFPWSAALFGALFGVCAYGTYDLTNDAVLRVWTHRLTVIDMCWGAFVTAVASLAGAWVERRRTKE